ncbi:MAG: hypothetical protein M1331_02890 [Candidatus Marsarchaeota archaeon]|nr:hypothetical protein [Candidatus Marsarchaeota archaeon]MCL5106313.1 hypothetical protein [Candidatus Marsarchaeota archaeon]
MKILKFDSAENLAKIKIDNFNDMLNAQRVIFSKDVVRSRSLRKFKPESGGEGELKEVLVELEVEKTEIDKDSERLRILGKIIGGNPLKYIQLHSYHTINIEKGNVLEIKKQAQWPNYLIKVLEDAVKDSKKPNLGVVLADDEKALFAYLLGYGIEFINDIYSGLSKRMAQKDFQEQKTKYFLRIAEMIKNMNVGAVIIGGPGFTKDDIKKFIEDSGLMQKIGKQLVFVNVSNVERSGMYELIKSSEVEEILKSQRLRLEFKLMEEFLRQVSMGKSFFGKENVSMEIENYGVSKILVNDNVLNDAAIRGILGAAEKNSIRIFIFNSSDEAGAQLRNFGGIAGIS